MAGTGMKVLILILSLAIGIGITYFASTIVPFMDDQMKIIAAVVLTISAYTALYFMTKGNG